VFAADLASADGPEHPVVTQRKESDPMVTVSLTGGSREDAATVFDVLRTAFPLDRPSDEVPHEQPDGRPLVWTSLFEPTEERIPTGPAPLEGSVTATLQAATPPWTCCVRPWTARSPSRSAARRRVTRRRRSICSCGPSVPETDDGPA